MICKTSKAKSADLNRYMFVEAKYDRQFISTGLRFKYINDPVINKTQKKKAIVR